MVEKAYFGPTLVVKKNVKGNLDPDPTEKKKSTVALNTFFFALELFELASY